VPIRDLAALVALGWGEPFATAFAELEAEQLSPARVGVEHRNRYLVLDGSSEFDARLAGKLKLLLDETGDRPVVGDWVGIRREGKGSALIQARLPRKSQFSRKVAGRTVEEQVMAANIDTVFLATALDGDLNPRRMERYLLLAWESKARPVILLTKADMVGDPQAAIADIVAVAQDVPVHVISSRTRLGLDELEPYLLPGVTITILGSSGVGKSTLINQLLGHDQLRTGEVLEDGRGRHTTTHRQLVRLPGGALIIDTPGLRELQLWEGDAGLQEAFADIDELAPHCRFTDCAHDAEPGCAVRAAVQSGELAPERFESYHTLKRELQHLEEKTDARARAQRGRQTRSMQKALRKRLEEKDR
jgi:ribosome biogenesis GTPase